MSTATEVPFWYEQALATPSDEGRVDVNGVSIRYVTWGEVGQPGVVLVHGSNAHLEWWRFVAPFLADQFRVAALDLSGNGDSGWRERYTGEDFAEEIWQVCQAASLGPMPYVVGHSFGGYAALQAARYHSEALAGLVLMDFTVAPPEQYVEWGKRIEREGVAATRKLRVYPTREKILGRFRLIPEQPGVHPLVLRHMAEAGIKPVEGGYTWKFDPTLFDHLEMGIDQRDHYAALKCPSALMLGEHSTDEGAFFADHMLEITGGYLPKITVPGTYHHLMFDNPIAVSMTLKALLAQWHQQRHHDQIQSHLNKTLNAHG